MARRRKSNYIDAIVSLGSDVLLCCYLSNALLSSSTFAPADSSSQAKS